MFQGGIARIPPNLRRTFNTMNFLQNSIRKPVPSCKRVSEIHNMLYQLYNLHEVLSSLKKYNPINLIISDKNLFTFLKTNIISVSTDYCDCLQFIESATAKIKPFLKFNQQKEITNLYFYNSHLISDMSFIMEENVYIVNFDGQHKTLAIVARWNFFQNYLPLTYY